MALLHYRLECPLEADQLQRNARVENQDSLFSRFLRRRKRKPELKMEKRAKKKKLGEFIGDYFNKNNESILKFDQRNTNDCKNFH